MWGVVANSGVKKSVPNEVYTDINSPEESGHWVQEGDQDMIYADIKDNENAAHHHASSFRDLRLIYRDLFTNMDLL